MALSEHEQRLLDQLEQQLHADDPKFASSMASSPQRTISTRRIVIGALMTVAGILILLLGVANQIILVGVAGFLVMGAGVYYATSRGKGSESAPMPQGIKTAPVNRSGGFLSTLEEKWDERKREQP
ncbi:MULTISPECIES: DUF3040 domain-containing protein [unclassified Arthrobacter]|uniref:DUF3040 domain-containing protein n=1 Tax=unclassified Arthrobacter TaxID=235627 RepID=UPI0004653217|nr:MULTISPECIES: DUF3040 domain-containing protein [unclassified Arthrobacter]PVE19526.1 DUF3040 domain-containing protein [Arthrobacter sp. Bz4]